MQSFSLECSVCGKAFSYPPPSPEHRHKELEIGGVPINFWMALYRLVATYPITDPDAKGILKYRQMLPLDDQEVLSQGEGNTPFLELDSVSGARVFLKDESQNPTGSFKDRGMPLLIAEARSLGKKRAAIPSTGNAGVSFVSYAGLAGIEPVVFLSKDTAQVKIDKMKEQGASLIFDKDLIESYEHFVRYCRKHHDVYNGLPATNVAYIQGLKTAAYEIYEQMGNNVPDWVVLPCGSGGNVLGYYYGFKDLMDMGLIQHIPRLVPVQIKGADPITYGFIHQIKDHVPVLEHPTDSRAEAIASDTCFNALRIHEILAATNGMAISVTDDDIDRVQGHDGLEFSSRAVFPALDAIQNDIISGESVVLVGTASSRKKLLVN